MPGSKTVWGIDVGQLALRGVKLQLLDNTTAELLAYDVVDYPQILSQPEANPDLLIAEAAEKFVSRNDLRGSAVVLGVPGQQTFTRFTKLPPVEPKKISSIVTYEAQQQIPFDMSEVIWDYQVFAAPDSPEVEVGIFAIRRDVVRKYLSVFVDKGIEPVLVQASPLSLYNCLAFDDLPGEAAVVILDVGAQNSDLVVARKDGAWTRNIPLGGNSFTETLVKNFKLGFAKAEALKRTAASSRYARQMFQAMRPVFADLVAEIQRSLGYYNSTHRDLPIAKIVGMGNAFKLPGLQKYLQQNLQMEVDKLSSFKKLKFASSVNPAVFNEYLLSMGVAYGLAVQGLGVGLINNSLLPPEIARTMVWRRKTPWFAGAAAMLLIGGLSLGYSRARVASAVSACNTGGAITSVADTRDAQAAIQTGASNLPTGRARAEKILSAAQRLKGEYNSVASGPNPADQLQQIADLYKDRTFWIELLERVHATLPPPAPELAAAQTPGEYLAALKSIPRSQRKVIQIEQLDAAYVTDTGAAFSAGSTGGSASDMRGGSQDRDAVVESGGPKGVIVILRGRTPYGGDLPKAVVFLTEWARSLAGIQGQTIPFHIGKIDEAPRVLPVSAAGSIGGVVLPATWAPPDATSGQLTRASLLGGAAPSGGGYGGGDRGFGGEAPPSRGGGGGRGFGGEAPPDFRGGSAIGGGFRAAGGAAQAALDPLTGEPTAGDYLFQLKFTVIRGPSTQDPAQPAPPPADGPIRQMTSEERR